MVGGIEAKALKRANLQPSSAEVKAPSAPKHPCKGGQRADLKMKPAEGPSIKMG